ncbi:MAG TPA: AlkA N-terminal domain-containing protein [Solirubrobacterales bacterium]|jgi:AraC family transcriptional regulator of adaptative response / DNA-3-methyladenine glycosylase II
MEARLWNRVSVLLDSGQLWEAIEAADSRFDGWVFCGVTSTGIYCRPGCPARTPKRSNVRLFATAAAAQLAGFRACKRCRPDAAPGSPEWDRRADLVGRAMRLIADGVVDREGVRGLSQRLGYTERHVHRQLVAVTGAGPLSLARAQRAQSARILLETTTLPITEVAFAAGFRSVRQFNATVREVFARSPSGLRDRAKGQPGAGGPLLLRLPYRQPFDAAAVFAFLGARAVPGVEELSADAYRRSLRLPNGAGIVELRPGEDFVDARFWLSDLRDLGAAMQRSRALLDLDSDPRMVVEALAGDPLIGSLVREAPGRRVPGSVDGDELAVRALLGQQVSLSAASTHAGRMTADLGEELAAPIGGVTHLFPSMAALAEADPARIGLPNTRRRALFALVAAANDGEIVLDAGAERAEVRRRLLELRGIGPWTVEYIAMRGLRDPDAFLASDLGVRKALVALGQSPEPAAAERLAERWSPYRAYAVQHLWASLGPPPKRARAAGLSP